MAEKIILEYKRVNVDKSTGRIVHSLDSTEQVLKEFDSIEFRPMLRDFAEALQQHPDAKAVWKRTDRAGLIPYDLDDRVTTLFRTDPLSAIQSMCPPSSTPSTTIKRAKEEREKRLVAVSVRAGFDTLADAFGDLVYARVRDRKGTPHVECPCCGLWQFYMKATASIWSVICANPKCGAFDQPLPMVVANQKWAGFPTPTLLQTKSTRFYFPRAWNDGRPWVSREDLSKKYDEYVSEKEKQS